MTAKLKTMTVSSFALGMNTRLPDFALKATSAPFGRFMREIINADISESGSLKLRRGYVKKLTTTAGLGLWSDDAQAYYVDGTSMFSVADVSGTLVSTPVTGASVASGAPVSFQSAPMGGAYWTDGTSNGYVLNGVSIPLVPPTPSVLPTVTTGAGALEAGIYSVVYTYLDSAGRESASTAPFTVALAANSSLIFTLATAGLFKLRVHVSLPNGIEMYGAAHWDAGTTGVNTLTTMSGVGQACITVGLQPLPAGRFIRYNNGRTLVAQGPYLFYSRPFTPGLYDPTMDFIPMPATITVCEIVSNQGVFVVADQTYYLEGDVATADLKAPLQFGAVMGSGAARPDISGCFWMSTRGIVVGNDDGSTLELQAENVGIALMTNGASLMVDRDGEIQLITSLYGAVAVPESEGSKYTSGELTDTSITGTAWVVAEKNKASWLYSNYTFTSYCEIASRYYGMRADGVYLLEGTTDAGTAIDASINPGRQDFGSPMRMRMENAYLTVGSTAVPTLPLSTGTMHLTITDDKGNPYTYDTRTNDGHVQQQRLDVGRGLNGNYLGFRITNDLGCMFELSKIELQAVETTRRLAG